MAIRPVRYFGDPVLREKARPIEKFDEALLELVRDMQETMHAYRGVGLAGNQVGVAQRVLVVDVPIDDETHARYTLVNPVLDRRSGSDEGEEGCLSIPGIYEDVKRAACVRVRAHDERGNPIEFNAEGYLARAVQHEVDHLDGVLFFDRLSILKRQFLRPRLDAIARGELPDEYRPPLTSRGQA
jgi:peptide deformylase